MNSVNQTNIGEKTSPMDDDITLTRIAAVLWRDKWLIAGITTLFGVLAIAYALLATEWYRADVLLVPAEEDALAGLTEQLGGLARLAGVSSASPVGDTPEAIAILQSRAFAQAFIEDKELMSVFTEQTSWADGSGAGSADMRDAVDFFHDNVLRVSEDRDTGQITLSVEWTDPVVASDWANSLVTRINERMRQRALTEAETNIAYLQSELTTNKLVPLEQSISRLLETEMQKMMLARGSAEFSFRVVDPATPPKKRARPKRTLIVVSVVFLGGMFALFVVFAKNAFMQRSSREDDRGP
jgi:uncharacterized protein involved in exopolysaccharide biosynthesis